MDAFGISSYSDAIQTGPQNFWGSVLAHGSVDNVVGVVQAKDILDRILDGGELSVSAALRQPMVVPDTVSALDAMERLNVYGLVA